jgi:uncharacterized membrane protein
MTRMLSVPFAHITLARTMRIVIGAICAIVAVMALVMYATYRAHRQRLQASATPLVEPFEEGSGQVRVLCTASIISDDNVCGRTTRRC